MPSTRGVLGHWLPWRLLTVIPNGVDLERFRMVGAQERARCRRCLGVPADADLVVFAARHGGMKNVPLLLASAAAFLLERPRGQVVACGAGMSWANDELRRAAWAAFAERPYLLRRLHALGVRDDMHRIYTASDVVAPTSSSGEATPLCLIEGIVCGANPVTTSVGDCTSIVDGHGIVVDARPGSVSAGWAEACDRRAQWLPALDLVRSRFGHTRVMSAYAGVIKQVARDVHAAAGRRK